MKMPLVGLLLLASGLVAFGAQGGGPVKVTIQTEKSEVGEGVSLPIDPTPRVKYGMQQGGTNMPGLQGANGERITYSPQGGHTIPMMIDGKLEYFGQGVVVNPKGQQQGKWLSQNVPLKGKPGARPRHGVSSEWVTTTNIHITQIVEIIPSRKPTNGGGKRQLDVMLVRYTIENKDTVKHTVGLRNSIDIYLINNDGALFASPTTHKGQIINGHEFKGDKVPEYLQVLQQPNLQNPGYVTHFTLKLGKLEPPTRFVCTTLSGVGGQWDVQVQAAGDSAVAIFFDPKEIPPGGKRDMAYAYGIGIASNPESEGRVNIDLNGSFEPGKQFTITAYVDDPIDGQALTLELPAGLQRVEGKTMQAVPEASERGQSIVIWKAKVDKLGSYPIKVRSSNGVTYNTQLTIEAAAKGEVKRIEQAPMMEPHAKTAVGVSKSTASTGPNQKNDLLSANLDGQNELYLRKEVIGQKRSDLAELQSKAGVDSEKAKALESEIRSLEIQYQIQEIIVRITEEVKADNAAVDMLMIKTKIENNK
ncbi:MAG TPA: hypothetical protein VE988_07100 [Gemmataceae bacterium]|nr:hypothetical protein [Gemmataceae bacterium]